MTDHPLSSSAERELRLLIRIQLRRLQAGAERNEALEGIMEAVREREHALRECLIRGGETLH